MAAVIVFFHKSFQFIRSRDAPVVPKEFLHLADEVFGEFHVEVRVLVDATQTMLSCQCLSSLMTALILLTTQFESRSGQGMKCFF